MITLSTNISKKLSSLHKKDVEDFVVSLFSLTSNLDLKEYKEKEGKNESEIKFILNDFPLQEMVVDIKKWDLFTQLLIKIIKYSKEDVDNADTIQFWITSLKKPMSVNVFFSTKNESDMMEKISSLRDTLVVSDVFNENNIQKGKVLIVGYENEESVWRINYI